MSLVKGLLWLLVGLSLIVGAMYVSGNFEVADYLTGLFLAIEPYLPMELRFEQFLITGTVLSLFIAALAIGGAVAAVLYLTRQVVAAKQTQAALAAAAERELGHTREQHGRQLESLIEIAEGLSKGLDKRVLVQGIVEAASRVTSVPQANSAVSLWLLQFDRDVMAFEHGRYCDAGFFAQAEFQPTDEPFGRVTLSRQPWLLESWEGGQPWMRPERAGQLSSATSAMVVPLVIEHSVLGALIIFCHPDVLKSYEQTQGYYDAVWGELALSLAIAVQGELAILDRLTGAHHREYFMKRLLQEIDRANRYQFPLSLLMVDIDNFKAVNDTLGHPQGDAVLKIIAKIIKKEIRAIDLLGRYGGEEFILLLPETGLGVEGQSASGALVVAERIRRGVEEEFRMMLKPLNLSVSVGVAVRRFPEDRGMDQRELIRLADEQLYRAKTTGKNRVCVQAPEAPQGVA